MIELNRPSFVNDTGVGYGSPLFNMDTGFQQIQEPNINIKDMPIGNFTATTPEARADFKGELPLKTAEEKAAEEQKELWDREDAIRKETQEREDTAYQRSINDMRKAGVNPNLQSVSGAQSGGGITSASKKELTRIEIEKDRILKLLIQEIEQNFDYDQKSKDRILGSIKTALDIIPF